MNHQTFINLQFKNSLHSFHIVLKRTSGDKIPFCLPVSLVLFWCLHKPPTFISELKDVTSWLLQDKEKFHSIEVLVDNVEEFSLNLYKFLGD